VIYAVAVILIGPSSELALRDAVFAAGFRHGDLSLEDLEDDRRLALGGPALELLGFSSGLTGGDGFLIGHLHFASEVSASRWGQITREVNL
jgi:hypothetical protein